MDGEEQGNKPQLSRDGIPVVKRRMEAEELQSSIHIVFGLSNAGSLKVTLSEIGKRQENKVLAFNDLFSIGPIIHLEKAEGQQRGLHWLMERFSDY